jgi:Ethylbenzene dehydrogenase
MKKAIVLLCIALTLFLQSCAEKIPEGVLVSKSVKSGPVMDGKLDDSWQLAKSLEIPVEVPDYKHFAEMYHGKKYDVTLRSVYTDSDIYIFAQWTGDEEKSLERQSWYFNDVENKWMQKPKKAPDDYSPPAYEDKFAFLWDISGVDFMKEGATIYCHEEHKHSNFPDEIMDIWHWKLVRTAPVHQLDDKHLVFAENADGRKGDEGKGSYSDNKQKLMIDGTELTLPLYWIPGREDYHWLMDGEAGAKKIVGMDENMNLIDEDGTVLNKEEFMLGSSKLIPSIKGIKPATSSRGDVTVYDFYDESSKTWNLEIQRKLTTGFEKDDVQFSDFEKLYDFSISVFNSAAIAHATPEGLNGKVYSLKFD